MGERRKKEKGVDESVRFMAHTREPLRAIIHPLAFYVWGHIVGFLTAAAMRLLGFSKHTAPNGIHYRFRAPKKSAPKRKTHKAAAVMPIFDDTSAAGATSAALTAPLLGARGGRVTREEEAEEGVVLVHRLGLTPYLSFLHMLSRSYSIKKLIVVELAHLAVRLSTSSPTIDDVADGLTDAMAVHGMQSAIFVGHLYGALVLARQFRVRSVVLSLIALPSLGHTHPSLPLSASPPSSPSPPSPSSPPPPPPPTPQQVRKRPEAVSAMGFVDPACILLCLPKVLFNFIYKVPGSPSIGDTMAEAVRWFLCGRELQVARALCRGFNWIGGSRRRSSGAGSNGPSRGGKAREGGNSEETLPMLLQLPQHRQGLLTVAVMEWHWWAFIVCCVVTEG
ncbi:unnamed protein product [Closterium sp. NIES-65]|nr:unnamed protein product [Closterium sp. NIES-65]CAI5963925.1 unnamed protein product [Closterium sp. NIES-65]